MSAPSRVDRSLIRVSGPDARSFLQNLLTQNLDAAGDIAYAALLSPQGKIVADMFVWADGDALVVDADPSRGADLLRRLSMYKLRAQVTLEDVSSAQTVLIANEQFDGATRDPRLAGLGWRKLVTGVEGAAVASKHDEVRIALGVPDLARDAQPEEVFALEALLEELNGVDFQKGCFIGQENVSRMKRRATTRKKFCPIVFEGEAPAFGTPVVSGAAELGTVRTGRNGRAIALLRLDRALAVSAPLSAGGKIVRLDPPQWLVLPAAET
jgi:folate-binding protein YgfZ